MRKKKNYVYGEEKVCEICGTTFRQRDSDTETKKSKFCSTACSNKNRTKHKERPCKICGDLFKPRRKEHVNCTRYCSVIDKNLRFKVNPMVAVRKKMAMFCCGTLHRCLKSKTDTTQYMLGYRYQDLIKHLENNFQLGMSWDNYGKGKDSWSIDHTRPVSSFSEDEDISVINALSNLMPMWHSQNCSKGNKWEGQ